ncbi:MAG: hypothetical protein DRO88_08075 [Promethearchaeia archaeon]|nr:MAG: hypothetical protein DRO88_08075 [Candidatus Lokiarchaeia archaeon]
MTTRHDDPFDFWDLLHQIFDTFDEMFNEETDSLKIDNPGNEQEEEQEEWFVDIFEEPNQIEVAVSLPCVQKEAVDLFAISSNELEIKVNLKSQRIKLPKDVDIDSATAHFNNGILDIIIPLVD